MWRRSNSLTLGSALLLFCFLTQACSLYRVHAPGEPGVTDRSKVVWSLGWGLAKGEPEVDCQGAALAELTIKSNLAYDLLSVLTLGLASPKKLEWKCASANPTPGAIPTPASLSDSEES